MGRGHYRSHHSNREREKDSLLSMKMHSHQNINEALLLQYLQQQSQLQSSQFPAQPSGNSSLYNPQKSTGTNPLLHQLGAGSNDGYFYTNQPHSTNSNHMYAGSFQSNPAVLNAQNSTYKMYNNDDERVYALVLELLDPLNRSHALAELSRHRDAFDDLALVVWHSFGVMACLIQELLMVYPLLHPPNLKEEVSLQVCNVLALLQVVASHPQTRMLFINAHIPLLLFPFLNTTTDTKPFEHLRLTSLGVIGALVKHDNPEITQVAIFIIQKIITDKVGLEYVCHSYERFTTIAKTLSIMVYHLLDKPSSRLLKHVVKCYLRLADNSSARNYLQQQLPEPLRDGTFSLVLKDDGATKQGLPLSCCFWSTTIIPDQTKWG